MSTVFMNSENSKNPNVYRLRLNLTDKKDGQRDDNLEALSSLSKNIKKQHAVKGSNWLMDLISYYTFRAILNTSSSSMIHHWLINHQLKYISTDFRKGFGYRLNLLKPETIQLSGSIEEKINKDKNGENGPHLENIKVFISSL